MGVGFIGLWFKGLRVERFKGLWFNRLIVYGLIV